MWMERLEKKTIEEQTIKLKALVLERNVTISKKLKHAQTYFTLFVSKIKWL